MRRVRPEESGRFQELMQAHHYLGALGKIGETLWYVASWRQEGWGCWLITPDIAFCPPGTVRMSPRASSRCASGACAPIGSRRSGIRFFCSRPSSTRGAIVARSTAPPTGSRSAAPADIAAVKADIPVRPTRPSWSSCAPCSRRRARCRSPSASAPAQRASRALSSPRSAAACAANCSDNSLRTLTSPSTTPFTRAQWFHANDRPSPTVVFELGKRSAFRTRSSQSAPNSTASKRLCRPVSAVRCKPEEPPVLARRAEETGRFDRHVLCTERGGDRPDTVRALESDRLKGIGIVEVLIRSREVLRAAHVGLSRVIPDQLQDPLTRGLRSHPDRVRITGIRTALDPHEELILRALFPFETAALHPERERRQCLIREAVALEIAVAGLRLRPFTAHAHRRPAPGDGQLAHARDVLDRLGLLTARVGECHRLRPDPRGAQHHDERGGVDPTAETEHDLASAEFLAQRHHLRGAQPRIQHADGAPDVLISHPASLSLLASRRRISGLARL